MEAEELAQLKHLRNIETQKKVSQENADIYYKNKQEVLLKQDGFYDQFQKDLHNNEEERSEESKRPNNPKPPKYPSPEENKQVINEYQVNLTTEEMDDEIEVGEGEIKDYSKEIYELEQDNPYIKNKHLNVQDQLQNHGFEQRQYIGEETVNLPHNEGAIESPQTEGSSETLNRAKIEDSNETEESGVERLNQREINNIQNLIKGQISNAHPAVARGTERFLQNLNNFRRERSESPANKEARNLMKEIVARKQENTLFNQPNIEPEEDTTNEQIFKEEYKQIATKFISNKRSPTFQSNQPSLNNLVSKHLEQNPSYPSENHPPNQSQNQEIYHKFLHKKSQNSQNALNSQPPAPSKLKNLLIQDISGSNSSPQNIFVRATNVLTKDGSLKPSFLKEIMNHIIERNQEESEPQAEAEEVQIEVDDRHIVGAPYENMNRADKSLSFQDILPENLEESQGEKEEHIEIYEAKRDTNIKDLVELQKLKRTSQSFKDIAIEEMNRKKETRNPSPILKRMATTMSNKGRNGNNVSFSIEDLVKAKMEESKISDSRPAEVSISFDKEEYAKEKLLKQTQIVGVMEKQLNRTLMQERFNTWKDIYLDIVRREENERLEKERKEVEFQKKVEAASKFRLKKILLYKHLIFRRIKRVLKAEKKWLNNVKKELTIYHKKRFFRYWKIYNGVNKLNQIRMEKTAKRVIQALKDHAERNALNDQIAVVYNSKQDKKKAFNYWLGETRKRLQIKANENKASKFYGDNLKRNAFKMFQEYLALMRKINADEFLKLGEKQDFFEIGITQVMMHKY